MVSNVLTHIAEAMIHIARMKPDDPIAYMHEFLLDRGQKIQADAEASAFRNFIEPLSEEEVQDFLAVYQSTHK